MYITPRRLRYSGLGVDLSGYQDWELEEHIAIGRAAIDAFCNVPLTPQPHSFLGGTIVDEQHGWGNRNDKRRIYPYHTPLRSVSSLRILATESLYVDFDDSSDYFVQENEGYVELVNFALTKIGIWGQAEIPQMGLIEPVGVISYTYGRQIPVEDVRLSPVPQTTSGDIDYTDYRAPDGFWDEDADIEISVDGSVKTEVTDFTVDREDGFVHFESALDADKVVRASYVARLPRDIARANALAAVGFIGEARLASINMTGIESMKAEELEIRRIGSRSGAEKGIALPAAAQSLLSGYVFMTVRGGG